MLEFLKHYRGFKLIVSRSAGGFIGFAHAPAGCGFIPKRIDEAFSAPEASEKEVATKLYVLIDTALETNTGIYLEQIIANHKQRLADRNIAYTGVTAGINEPRKLPQSCRACGYTLGGAWSSGFDCECNTCGWVVCPQCATCGCGITKT